MSDEDIDIVELCIATCENIERAIIILQMDRNTFYEFQKAVTTNHSVMSTHFPETIARWYASSILLGLRRLVDDDKKCYSLQRLLVRMLANPRRWSLLEVTKIFSRVSHNYSDETIIFLAKSTYEEFADSTGEKLNIARVQADLTNLEQQLSQAKEIVDRTIAHHDRRGIDSNLSFHDLECAITTCEKIALPYIALLTGRSYDSLTPIDQMDWPKIFDHWRSNPNSSTGFEI